MTAMQNHIQLANISEELTQLWDKEQGQNKIRASLFSLILYVQKNDKTPFFQSLIKSVVSKFPCRVILIINEALAKEEYLRTAVSSETIGEGDLKIFCETIQIEVAGKLIERVPFIVLPQILPDLPVYLLWTQDPSLENAVLPHLEPLANRIIFDSGSTDDLQNYGRCVLSLIQRFHCAIGDLNWSALSGWRSIFLQVFNTQETLLSLAQSTLIRIHYNENQTHYHKHTLIEAAYFQAWLASRLNLKFQSIEMNEGNVRLTYKRPLKDMVVMLTPQEMDTQPPGAILSIEIESAKNKGVYSFKRHPQSRQVFIQYSEKDFCQIPYSAVLKGAPEGQEIIEEIFYPSGGRHYRDMLEILAATPWRRE
jgi:glucose-6-phosphate dehydrogenase assembly protein OpcA